jgi:RNA polymerase sigma factor (sigma-70 family)
MTEPRTDFDLLDAWARGDQAAGRELYDRYFALLFRFLRTKVEAGRDDLLQNVWLACIEGRERVRNRDSFRAYMLQTARFQLYAFYRKRNQSAPVDFGTSSVVDLSSSPSSLIVQREQERLLLEALRRVPLDHQIVIELSYWDELTGPEIAEVLCIPEGTVRSRLRRATEQLRQQMAALSGTGTPLPDTEDDLHEWALRLREQAGSR